VPQRWFTTKTKEEEIADLKDVQGIERFLQSEGNSMNE
jgi:hypothetical protein